MDKLDRTPTYYKVMESYIQALKQGSMQSSSKEIVTASSYEQIDSMDSFKIYQDVTVVIQGLISTLPTNEMRMIMQIIDELYMNNALWYHEPKDSRDYKTLKALIGKHILRKTEDKNIFLVNPYCIRRGTIPSVLSMTMEHLSTSSRVHKELICNLRYRKVEVNKFDLMSSDSFSDSLLLPITLTTG